MGANVGNGRNGIQPAVTEAVAKSGSVLSERRVHAGPRPINYGRDPGDAQWGPWMGAAPSEGERESRKRARGRCDVLVLWASCVASPVPRSRRRIGAPQVLDRSDHA